LPDITDDLTIDGSAPAMLFIVSGSNSFRVFTIGAGVTATIHRLDIENGVGAICANSLVTCGGAILNNGTLTVRDSTLAANSAIHAGGIGNGGAIDNEGTLTVLNTTLYDNIADGAAGNGGHGGAIYNNGTLFVANSSFIYNRTTSLGSGGAITNNPTKTATIVNSTFSDNISTFGGGISNQPLGTLNVTNSTFSNNYANNGGFGGGIQNSSVLNIRNTIIANSNSGGDCENDGSIPVNINNLVEDGSCSPSLSGDPLLGYPLNNGGPTQTMALQPGSPAIDAGNDAVCAAASGSPDFGAGSADQRGMPRPQGTHCDLGAYEVTPIATFSSLGTYDGQIIEKTRTSETGGTANSFGGFLAAGDTAFNQQVVSILHFNTASLPDNAVITGVRVQIKQYGSSVGANPLYYFGFFNVDIVSPYFGLDAALKPTDFAANASLMNAGPIDAFPLAGNWYQATLYSTAFPFINRSGSTQFRLRFDAPDNNNNKADQFRFYSGNATAAYRPVLIVDYYVP
jgi:hypothetical protein